MPLSNLPPVIGEALSARGYDALTPVQQAVTEPEAHGRDMVVSAQTGSGKTVAFGLALAPELLDAVGGTPLSEKPLALVIAPTRELALQVSRELGWLYAGAGLRIATCVGGMDASKERRALRAGPAIVVGTPGRLAELLRVGRDRRSQSAGTAVVLDFANLETFVLDEADALLDEADVPEVRRFLDDMDHDYQLTLFSATIGANAGWFY